MSWKKGIVTFDDGTSCKAQILLSKDGSVYNLKITKDGKDIKEVEVEDFAKKLGKSVEDIYPYNIEIIE